MLRFSKNPDPGQLQPVFATSRNPRDQGQPGGKREGQQQTDFPKQPLFAFRIYGKPANSELLSNRHGGLLRVQQQGKYHAEVQNYIVQYLRGTYTGNAHFRLVVLRQTFCFEFRFAEIT